MSRVDIEESAAYNEPMNSSRTTTHKLQSLVAMDYSGEGNLDRVISFVDKFDALVWVETVEVAHFRDEGRMIPTHRVTFDANKVRNTEVHAASFGAGFVSHIE